MSSTKYIYDFSEGSADMRLLLGGKGANLAQMWKIGLPVPPGFIITTEACHQYWKENDFIAGIWSDVEAAVGRVEKLTGKNFGSSENPLLVSVRSGAPVSMPGMMDTILNLGLNDDTVKALAKSSGNERFAYDSYRRFIQMFSDVVLGVDLDKFEKRLEQARDAAGVKEDYKIPAEELKKLVEDYKQIVADAGHTFPTDPWKQLRLAIDAVFRSWNTPRAITYRKINDAYHFLTSGAELIATHPDDLCPTEDSYDIDIGPFIRMLEQMCQTTATVIGKPNRLMLEMAAGELGVPPEDTVMVGDRLTTDIEMAVRAGTQSILVLSGETDREMLARWGKNPTAVVESVADIPAMVLGA